MGEKLSRSVEIQISNETQNVTLKNPRTYFYNGYSSVPPRPSVPPGSHDSCKFSSPRFKGCVGVLAYEAATFTLAIYFCNPLDYNLYSMVLGLEISLDKGHPDRLEDVYTHMAEGRAATYAVTASDRVTLRDSQRAARVSAGRVQVGATMSNDRHSVIRLVVEELETSGMEAGKEFPSKGKSVVVSAPPAAPEGTHGHLLNLMDVPRAPQAPLEPPRYF